MKGTVISMFKGFGMTEIVDGSKSGYMVFEYGRYQSLMEKMKKRFDVDDDDNEKNNYKGYSEEE